MAFNHVTFKEYMDISKFTVVNEGYLYSYFSWDDHFIKVYMLECISNMGKLFNLIRVMYYRGEDDLLTTKYDNIIEVGKSKQGKQLLSGKKYINYNNRTFKKLD